MDSEVRFHSNVLKFMSTIFNNFNTEDTNVFLITNRIYASHGDNSGGLRKLNYNFGIESFGIRNFSRRNLSDKENSEELRLRLTAANKALGLPEKIFDVSCREYNDQYGCEVRFEYLALFNKMQKELNGEKNIISTNNNITSTNNNVNAKGFFENNMTEMAILGVVGTLGTFFLMDKYNERR